MSNEEYWHKIEVAERSALTDEEVVVENIPETRLQKLRRQIESHDLPIRSRLESLEFCIEEAIGRSGMFLLVGETGSGKSLYSPLAVRNVLKKLGLPDRIIMLEPRKDAAKGTAEGHCAVIGGELGRDVGYSTSETKMVDYDTPVRMVTSGILPRYLFNGTVDNTNTGAIILDEVHDGSLDYHYVFGLLKELRAEGKAPFVFLTSATVDPKKFQGFFGFDENDFMWVEGRTFPVEIQYQKERKRELSSYNTQEIAKGYVEETADLVRQAIESEREGDILVFLPGAREIDDCIERLSDIGEIEILPLHGGLSFDERNRALSGERDIKARRRIIVATNVAETSVTVPNVTIVVDSCRRHSMKYDPMAGISRKVTEYISQEEAWQRAGRAGRIAEGACFRSLTQEEFDRLPKHAVTEIERTNLAHLILRLRGHGRDPETFPFFVQPNKEALHAGVEQLKILGALDGEGKVTEIGKRMLDMPFKPEDARMLVEAKERGCTDAALTLALLAREQKLYVYPTAEEIDRADGFTLEERKISARNAIAAEQAQFEQDGSDWAKRLNIFIQAIDAGVFECLGDDRRPEVKRAMRDFRDWCRMYHLNAEAIRHVAYRFYRSSQEAGIDFDRDELAERLRHTDPGALNASILAGYQERLLKREEMSRLPAYTRLHGDGFQEINFSPDSSAFARLPEFCIAGGINEGSGRAYGNTIKRNYASLIHPASLEDVVRLMGDRLKAAPRAEVEFDVTLGRAVQMTEYSLRRGEYREDYLGAAGVPLEGERATRMLAEVIVQEPDKICDENGHLPHFWTKNNEVMDTLKKLRTRSLGQVVLPNEVEWYVRRLGNAVTLDDARRIDRFLEMNIAEFCSDDIRAQIERDYPESIDINGKKRQVEYEEYPGDFYTASRFQASLTLSPQEVIDLPGETMFEVGPTIARQAVVLRMMEDGVAYASTSLQVLKSHLGGETMPYEIRRDFRAVRKQLEALVRQISAGEQNYRELGFMYDEFQALQAQLRWCEDTLGIEGGSAEEGRKRIDDVRITIASLGNHLREKQREYRESRDRKTRELQEAYEEMDRRLIQQKGRLPEALYSTLSEKLYQVYKYVLDFQCDKGRTLLAEVGMELDTVVGVGGESMRMAFARANEDGTSGEAPQQSAQSAVPKLEQKRQAPGETVMTPEIRSELRDEVAYLEVVLEFVFSQASPILAEPRTKIRTKAQEAADRVDKRRDIRRELKEVSREVESDEVVAVVRGHIGGMRASVNALVKSNLPHMVVGYDKNWVEKFRDLWDEVPHAVASSALAQEFISEGYLTNDDLTGKLRGEIKTHIPSLVRGEEVKVTLTGMIERAINGRLENDW